MSKIVDINGARLRETTTSTASLVFVSMTDDQMARMEFDIVPPEEVPDIFRKDRDLVGRVINGEIVKLPGSDLWWGALRHG